ncbi:tRNA uridine-5-carboxymethylaminomethyl(34) synthesis GTPase MnmE [Reyranella sp. CPCC 100927]|uniref:tRNA uridine-5-carboxymethylaminomethyl(34) synthesis GTPase MnmE n=1 Tax=Reyranella sp. CPCC 100927 TaxID=2599616 RepID=UPI0011B6BB10|nr:tRNA uridine-5-carboxymethylaminomethyl(34) synthesis GTPase MnmE [Reyranella sp. CPCC 100927]TWT14791.1 tRNA uridine-5-carboxymethylaminomethyl(34) synthesis GTPase MnmE [Reyranella sp. CPCC 100927]
MTTAGSDTIYALASALPARRGGAGVAVIRLSGPRVGDAFVFLTEPGAFARGGSARDPALPPPRQPVLRPFLDPVTGEVIDRGLAMRFAAPRSYTGEDVAEFHLHGGRAVIEAALAAIARLPFCRLAEPGEFTRRAFEHGKLDLTAAEGIADLVGAETAAQRRQALRQVDGALGLLYEDWRTVLLRALAHLEADIDFPDEDLPHGIAGAVRPDLVVLRAAIAGHLDDRRGERLRDGVSIAIVGPPNAGKSSLLNLIAQREAAIVSTVAGTTRDVIDVHLDLDGYPVTVADTAGLRDTVDPIEVEGVRRARARAEDADLRVLVVPAAAQAGQAADWPAMAAAARGALTTWQPAVDVIVVNKIDLVTDRAAAGPQPPHVAVSAQTGEGVPALLKRLGTAVARLLGEAPDGDADTAARDRVLAPPPLTRARHREALTHCLAALDRALAPPTQAALPELMAEDVRLAARALGRITGRVGVEDLLDVIFRDFCIGK